MGFNWLNIGGLLRRREVSSESAEGSGTAASASRVRGGVQVFSSFGGGDALAVAAVYRCAALLSDSVAGLRLRYMALHNGRYVEEVNSPLHYLLTVQPQPEMSAFAFWSDVVMQMLMEGNAYIYPRRVMGEVTDLVLCHRHSVSHDTLNNTYTVSDAYNGVYGTFGEDEMIHLFLHTSDGRRGESVLTHARRTM